MTTYAYDITDNDIIICKFDKNICDFRYSIKR